MVAKNSNWQPSAEERQIFFLVRVSLAAVQVTAEVTKRSVRQVQEVAARVTDYLVEEKRKAPEDREARMRVQEEIVDERLDQLFERAMRAFEESRVVKIVGGEKQRTAGDPRLMMAALKVLAEKKKVPASSLAARGAGEERGATSEERREGGESDVARPAQNGVLPRENVDFPGENALFAPQSGTAHAEAEQSKVEPQEVGGVSLPVGSSPPEEGETTHSADGLGSPSYGDTDAVQIPICRRFSELSLEEESVLFRNRVSEVYDEWWERERTPEDMEQEKADLRQAGLNPESDDDAESAAALEWQERFAMQLAIETVQREWEEKARAAELKSAG